MSESDSDASFVSADEDEEGLDPLRKRRTRHRGYTGDTAEVEHGIKLEPDIVKEKVGKKVTLPPEKPKPEDSSESPPDDIKKLKDDLDKTKNSIESSAASENSSATSEAATPTGQSPVTSSWGWSSWGNAIVSTAAASVTTFKQQVGEGLTTVLGTVENTFGAPSPEEIAASIRQEERGRIRSETDPDRSSEPVISLDVGGIPEELSTLGRGILSTMTSALEATGSRVIQTSLDTLEIIGKKTMDVIQEGDPGLKKKRAALNSTMKPQSLSEVLREAKENFEKIEDVDDEGNTEVKKTICYSSLFDEFHGLVHLEALEMLSQQNDAKLNSIMMSLLSLKQRDEMEPEIAEIITICEVVEPDSLDCSIVANELVVSEKLKSLGSNLLFDKLFEIYSRGNDILLNWPKKIEAEFIAEKHDNMITLLAEITAKSVEILHKIAELLLLPQFMSKKLIAKNLSDFSLCVCCKINSFAAKFSEQCNLKMGDLNSDKTSALITNVFLEASNSCSYVQDALQLVVPIINYTVTREILDRT